MLCISKWEEIPLASCDHHMKRQDCRIVPGVCWEAHRLISESFRKLLRNIEILYVIL